MVYARIRNAYNLLMSNPFPMFATSLDFPLCFRAFFPMGQLLDCSEDRVLSNGFLHHVDDPEQCNAMGASLWEAVAMTSHYHPAVAASARGALMMGTLEPRFQDSNKILREFSTKAAGFNPGIRAPREHPQRKRERLFGKKVQRRSGKRWKGWQK